LPAIILYFSFFIIPAIQGIYYSFTYWNIFDARFVGIDNYINLLTDRSLNVAIKNTFIFTVLTTFFKMIVGLALALIFNKKFKTADIVRSIYFMPSTVSNVAIALTFSVILHPEGILNSTLRGVGIGFLAKDWLTDVHIVMYSISAIEVWKWSGFTMVILLAGLQSIPNEYYETAEMDGSSAINKFKHITFPLLMPAMNNALLISLIGGIKVFDLVYALTGGGPGNASEVLNSFVFKAYLSGNYGEACAAGLMTALAAALISLPVIKFLRKREVEV
jgi:ABC-type sugar transport systems, permease components